LKHANNYLILIATLLLPYRLTDFHETWQERHTTRRYLNIVFLSLHVAVSIAAVRTSEMVATPAPRKTVYEISCANRPQNDKKLLLK